MVLARLSKEPLRERERFGHARERDLAAYCTR